MNAITPWTIYQDKGEGFYKVPAFIKQENPLKKQRGRMNLKDVAGGSITKIKKNQFKSEIKINLIDRANTSRVNSASERQKNKRHCKEFQNVQNREEKLNLFQQKEIYKSCQFKKYSRSYHESIELKGEEKGGYNFNQHLSVSEKIKKKSIPKTVEQLFQKKLSQYKLPQINTQRIHQASNEMSRNKIKEIINQENRKSIIKRMQFLWKNRTKQIKEEGH